MQPTHARWEKVPAMKDDEAAHGKGLGYENGVQNGGMPEIDTMDVDTPKVDTIFSPVKPIYSHNYLIIDTKFESPHCRTYGTPGPDGECHDIGSNGLSGISEDILMELPPECRAAFDEAVTKERQWKNKWGTENADGMRAVPIVDKGYVFL